MLIFLLIISTVSVPSAQTLPQNSDQFAEIDSLCAGFSAYLGLALPYLPEPDTIFLDAKESKGLTNKTVELLCRLDKGGKVIAVQYGADSAAVTEPVDKYLRKLRFSFRNGRALPFPQLVPVRLRFVPGRERGKAVIINCPVTAIAKNSDAMVSNSELLDRFFNLNNITPPAVFDIPPLAFKTDIHRKDGRYYTITALLKLDEAGELEDVSFPIPGMADMNHPVMMAMIRSKFTPTKIGEKPIASECLLTFRIFDNLEYPYHPDLAEASDSSLIATRRWFMRRYFNPLDISAPPLPREFPYGHMPVSGLSLKANGYARVEIIINDSGLVKGVSVKSVTEGLKGYVRDIVKRLNFYPAVDTSGRPVTFIGFVRMEIGRNREVVYNPEWR